MDYALAQVNVGRLVAPLDSPRLADFVAGLDPVNAVADAAPGFVWRLQTEDGNATAIRAFEQDAEGADGGILVNMSVWESVEALGAYVYGEAHRAVLRRRREWFEHMKDGTRPCGGFPAATSRRSARPRTGCGTCARTAPPLCLHAVDPLPSPGESVAAPLASPDDWTCPV